jgi:hypothetical protein
MRGRSLITGLLILGVSLGTFGIRPVKSPAQEPPKLPTFGCDAGPGQECSFVIGDEHGNLNFVVSYHQTHVMNAEAVGRKYCVNWGPPKQQPPAWPKCLNLANGSGHRSGIAKAGYNE